MTESKFTPPKSAHWYKPDGTPQFEIPKKSGKGMKKPNITDARELGLLPSVTTILRCIDKPFLTAWMKNQILDASISVSQEVGQLDDVPRRHDDVFGERTVEVDAANACRRTRVEGLVAARRAIAADLMHLGTRVGAERILLLVDAVTEFVDVTLVTEGHRWCDQAVH